MTERAPCGSSPARGPISLAKLAAELDTSEVAFTRAFNVTGQPAISLPAGRTDQGLPIGVQLVADHGREDVLLAVAAQMERARPWRDEIPAL